MASRSSLQVRRLTSRYRIASDHPDPQSLRRHLDGLLRRDLPRTLAVALAGLDGDERVVLIERLEVDLVLNATQDAEALVGRWSRGILRELGLSLAGTGARGVIAFANPDAYRASFLQDLLQGQAWGQWYYRRFDGLRSLPLSQALRTLLCDGETDARALFSQLPGKAVEQLCEALSEQDSARVLLALAGAAGEEDPGVWLSALTAVLVRQPSRAMAELPPNRCALRLSGEALRQGDRLPSGPRVAELALAVARLLSVFVREGAGAGERLVDRLLSGDAVAIYRERGGDAGHWLPLSRVDAARLKSLSEAMGRHASGTRPAGAGHPASASPAFTRFGGLFLLLPLLDSLPLAGIAGSWPDPGAGDAPALLRLLLMMKALGQPRAGALFVDPLARELLKLPPALTPGLLRRWQASLSSRQLDEAMEHLHRWQLASGIAGAEEALIAGVREAEQPLALLIDAAGGWLGISPLQADRQGLPGVRFHGLAQLPLKRLRAAPALSLPALESLSDLPLIRGGPEDGPAQAAPALAETLARLDRLSEEWRYLSLPPAFRGSRAADRTLSLLAQGLLRALARRLPGFAHASLPYLYANFLNFGARCEGAGRSRRVLLEPPPLQPVLGMTGLARGSVRLSWLPELRLELRASG